MTAKKKIGIDKKDPAWLMSRFHVFSGRGVMFIHHCAIFVVILIAKWSISDTTVVKRSGHIILGCIERLKTFTFFPEKQLILQPQVTQVTNHD